MTELLRELADAAAKSSEALASGTPIDGGVFGNFEVTEQSELTCLAAHVKAVFSGRENLLR